VKKDFCWWDRPRWIRRVFCIYAAYKREPFLARVLYSWFNATPEGSRIQRWAWRNYNEVLYPGWKAHRRWFFICNDVKFQLLRKGLAATGYTRQRGWPEPNDKQVAEAYLEAFSRN
jgi:hypothetical protein